ncbi:MAG: electron transport complex subunit RsxC [Thermotogae bacterium]|nr:electron transport complex subunit RsxC [Thermotogota bacterium]
MAFLSFKGGVHPPERKNFSEKESIKQLPLPEKVYMYLSNHIGAPAKLIVEPGQKVKTGQKIAEANGFISANLHSPVTGQVTEVVKMLNAASGKNDDVVIITREADDDWELVKHNSDYTEFKPEEISEIIKEAGIVGLGGAMFPAHVKLSIPKDKKAEVLVINAAECEPYLTIDHRMMLEKTDEILKGIEIIKYALGIKNAKVGIENNKPDAIKLMKEKASKYPQTEILELKTKYPQGAEKQLITAVTGKEVPSGKLPIDIGAVVFNVSTVYAVYDAVINGKPLVERGITITGEAVKNPGNFWYRIGTTVDDLLSLSGVKTENPEKVLYGGPMMGIPLPKTELPTFKGNNGLTFFSSESNKDRETMPCIRCSYCVMSCPIHLQPYLLKRFVDQRNYDEAVNNGILDCIECGSCSYGCPSNIDLAKTFKTGKKVIRAMKQRRV